MGKRDGPPLCIGLAGAHIKLSYLFNVVGQIGLGKQWRSSGEVAESGAWPGSTPFATHPAILDTFIGTWLVETLEVRSHLNGSNIFGTMEISSRYG